WVFKPGRLQLTPQPAVGATRAMTSPVANLLLHDFAPTNVIEDVLSRRQGLQPAYNLLDSIPSVGGYYPIQLREADRFNSKLYASREEYPRVEAFLGVSHVNAATNALAWETRTNYLPLVTAGQRVLFSDDDGAMKAIFAPEFDSRRVVYLTPDAQGNIPSTEP